MEEKIEKGFVVLFFFLFSIRNAIKHDGDRKIGSKFDLFQRQRSKNQIDRCKDASANHSGQSQICSFYISSIADSRR